MGNSFQDLFLKAGLVDKKQVNKAKRDNYVSKKKKGKKSSNQKTDDARQEQIAEKQRVQKLNKQRDKEKQQQEIIAQVRQLIETNRIRLDNRDSNEPYYFVVGKLIKKIYVSEKITKQLSKGALAIVTLDDEYQVIPANVARQVASRDKEKIVVFHDSPNNKE